VHSIIGFETFYSSSMTGEVKGISKYKECINFLGISED